MAAVPIDYRLELTSSKQGQLIKPRKFANVIMVRSFIDGNR